MSLNKEHHRWLTELASSSIRHGLQTGKPLIIDLAECPAELAEQRATFVTLQKQHQLRGCIGTLDAVRPLAVDIAENAFSAAFRDPRFPPLEAHELSDLDIHLSILTPAEPIAFTSEQDLLKQLQAGIDGLDSDGGGPARHISALGMGIAAGARTVSAVSETEGRARARLLVRYAQGLPLPRRNGGLSQDLARLTT